MVELYVLPAMAGDCLLIRYGKPGYKFHNILVDGGVSSKKKQVSQLIDYFYENKEKVDIIITHVDSDHIAGIIGGIKICDILKLNDCINNIYFNTVSATRRVLKILNNSDGDPLDLIVSNFKEDGGYSISEGLSLIKLIERKGLKSKHIDYIISGQEKNIEGAKITIISPTHMELEKLACTWKKCSDLLNLDTVGYSSNYPDNIYRDLSELKNVALSSSDSSIYNQSSIAFLFEFDDTKLLFLGDASAEICYNSLKSTYDKPITLDVIKLSHHGSSKNISDNLLEMARTDTYILSTNGRLMNGRPKMPDKHTLARILANRPWDTITLLCNYDWWNTCYHGMFFTDNDFDEYINPKKLKLIKLSDQKYNVKKGLDIYGIWGK